MQAYTNGVEYILCHHLEFPFGTAISMHYSVGLLFLQPYPLPLSSGLLSSLAVYWCRVDAINSSYNLVNIPISIYLHVNWENKYHS